VPQDNATPHHPANHLAGESSPYLLSHAHNPVDWYPWSAESLALARQRNRPIFLSIGYAACHWCHVMERESFEDESIARFLNDHYVSIKVDREQRPDLDHIYMAFTQAMTGSGGWPMSVFLTPDLKPFFAGTYFPPDNRYGRPGFMTVITEIAKAYEEDPAQIVESAEGIFEEIKRHLNRETESSLLSQSLIAAGAESLVRNCDPVHGGLGRAPKFPHPLEMALLLRQYTRAGDLRFLQAAEKGLTAMANGGIYDQIGGGFARYSTDEQWLVPHFEKMLYDNALLVTVYGDAFRLTGKPLYRNIVTGTLDFLLREMTDRSGGFYSSLDADSEGEEGKFYLWTPQELAELLGDDTAPFARYYNVTAPGHFEGKSILHVTADSEQFRESQDDAQFSALLGRSRARLLEERARRVRPATDDKILTSWNGLTLSAFAHGYQITTDTRYLAAARANGQFVRNVLWHEGVLTHASRNCSCMPGEFLEDYAYYVRGLLDLFESDPGPDARLWLELAANLADRAIHLFFGTDHCFYLRPDNQPDLILRPKEVIDSATPSAGSIMIHNLLKLHRLTDNASYQTIARDGLNALTGSIRQYPGGMASALLALDYLLGDKIEIVIVGDGPVRDEMLNTVYQRYSPNRLLVMDSSGEQDLPLLAGRRFDGQVKAYVCYNSSCQLPALSAAELEHQLGDLH
jgi:uncharacterized protein